MIPRDILNEFMSALSHSSTESEIKALDVLIILEIIIASTASCLPTDFNVADMLTKALPRAVFEQATEERSHSEAITCISL
jgi:hypothetical protein